MEKLLISVVAGLLLAGAPAAAQEHPSEHPKAQAGEHPSEHPKAKAKEHPEHPKGKPLAGEVGSKKWKKQVSKEFDGFVCDHTKKPKGEGFLIRDAKLNKDWKLKMVRVHKDKIVHLGENRFFACADLKSIDSKDKLDLDFYAKKLPDGSWKMEKVLIHKLNGKPRYTYNERNEMVPVK